MIVLLLLAIAIVAFVAWRASKDNPTW